MEPELDPTFFLGNVLEDYHQYQGSTNDCGPTVAAILGNAYLGEDRFQGPEVAAWLNKVHLAPGPLPRPVVGRIPGWATFPWGITRYLKTQGIPGRWKPLRTQEDLLHGLRADRLMAVVIGEPFRWEAGRYKGWSHYLVPCGYDQQEGYLFLDPAVRKRSEGDRWERAGLVWKPEREFQVLWRKMLRMLITVG